MNREQIEAMIGSRCFDLACFVEGVGEWSDRVFGPGNRSVGIVDHIRKELAEILAKPDDLVEWVDVMILALDGARRSGHSSSAICAALADKMAVNRARKWGPNTGAEKAIEHIRE